MIPQMATDALVACRLTGEVRWTFCMPHLLRCGNFCMPLWRGGACGGEVRWTFCMPHLLLCGNLLAYVAQVLAYVAQVLAYVARV